MKRIFWKKKKLSNSLLFFSIASIAVLFSLDVTGQSQAADYYHDAVTEICGAAGLTLNLYVGDELFITNTQTSCGSGDVTGFSSFSSFEFLQPNPPDYTFHWTFTAAGSGTVPFATADLNVTVTAVVPTVATSAASSVSSTSAIGNGDITALGAPNPTQHGVCWSTTSDPTTSNDCTTEGSASSTGAFASNMNGLTPNTLYHYRAYATNSAGTAYGSDTTFNTNPESEKFPWLLLLPAISSPNKVINLSE